MRADPNRDARRPRLAALIVACCVALPAAPATAEVATDQQQVAVGYERLETLALRIADAVEADDPARAEQMRAAIAQARATGIQGRFAKVIGLLERERFAAARRDQTEVVTQLEELLRLVMADPSEARRAEQRERLERLRRELRAGLREQKALRARATRGEAEELAPRQEELASRIERLIEDAEEADRLAGREAQPEQAGDKPAGEPGEGAPDRSISGKLRSSSGSMRSAGGKLAEGDPSAKDDQREAQRDLEAAAREAEERLKQLREEERERRLASLAERFRRMHEAQTGLVTDTKSRLEAGAPLASRAARLAVAKLADRQAAVASAGGRALKLVQADGQSVIFDQALRLALDDMRTVERRLNETLVDATTVALETAVVDALAEMITAVDESLDELQQRRAGQQQGQAGGPGGGGAQSRLVSLIAELRMVRAMQARLMRQITLWSEADAANESAANEAARRLEDLAEQQRRLSEAADAIAAGGQ